MMGTIASMAVGLTFQHQTRGCQGSSRADGTQPAGFCPRRLAYGRRQDMQSSATPGYKRPRLSQLVAAVLTVPAIIMLLSEFATASGHIEGREEIEFEGTFSDDENSIHEYNIEFLVQQGLQLGCGDNRFCPSSAVTRAQMLDFIYQTAIHLYGTLPYEELKSLQDAAEHATRSDAAEMLVAVFEHLSVLQDPKGIFADMDDMPEATTQAVEYLYGTGVVQGCATDPLRFCPSEKTTRAQMASFLARVIQADNPTVGLVLDEPDSAKGYALFSQRDYPQVYLVDDLGRKVHVWTLDGGCFLPKLLENGNLMCLYELSSRVAEISPSGNTVWEYTFPGMHHDFIKLPNGNILLLLRYFKSRDEAIAAGAKPDCVPTDGIRTDYLLEIEPTGTHSGKVVWEWHVWDHLIQDLYPDKLNYGVIAEHPERIDINFIICSSPLRANATWRDWTHINSLDFNPISNQIMLSVRNFSELWVIDHSTTTEQAAGSRGDLIYRWGNPEAYRAGHAEDREFFWQHHAHWIPSGLSGHGNILVFNNGANGRGYSSIDEIIPPPSLAEDSDWRLDPGSAAEPAEPIWVYTAENPTEFYAAFKSGAQRISNGNTFITVNYQGTIFQVTPDKRIVWKYVSPVTTEGIIFQGETSFDYNGIYRATWYPRDYPGLQGLNLTPAGPLELYR